MPSRFASLDLGTNTCLLLIMEGARVLLDEATVVRLGEGVDAHRSFQPAAIERTLYCLKRYRDLLAQFELLPQEVVCVATSQARDVQHLEFFDLIQKEIGFSFQVLSGEEEARLTFLGTVPPSQEACSCVLDIGGGSTELMSLTQAVSAQMGSVRLTERWIHSDPVSEEEFLQCQAAIDAILDADCFQSFEKKESFIAVAGTATTLAAWVLELKKFDAQKVEGLKLSQDQIRARVFELKRLNRQERLQLPGMEPMRADVIFVGALILWRSLVKLNYSFCQISTRGLRYGVLYESFKSRIQRMNEGAEG